MLQPKNEEITVAAADIFLTIKGPDISGESLDKVHSGMIECLSWHWGATNLGTASTGGGAGAGAVVKHDLTITKYVDKSSNVLFQGCAAGVHYTSATLYVRKSGGDPLDYLQIDLGGVVFISGYNVGGQHGDTVVPVETVTLNFSTMMMTYNQQAATGAGAGAAPLGYDFGQSAKM
jgi:type VI secretion system secreted protein Hcp